MTRLQYICLVALFLDVSPSHQEDSERAFPRGLPEDNSRYKTIQANTTLLRLLMEPNRDENTRSEIFDMLHSRDQAPSAAEEAPAFPEDAEAAAGDASQPPDMQAELVQVAGTVVEKDSKARVWTHAGHTHEMAGRGAYYRGAMSAVMVGVTLAVVLLAYLGLVAYRRREMIKNGTKHELLRNEEAIHETRIEL